MSTISTDLSNPESPMFDTSVMSGASSPLITTPPEGSSVSSTKTPVHEPPSPPMSDASAPPPLPKVRVPSIKTPVPGSKPKRSRLPSMDTSVTPRPKLSSSTASRPSRPATNTTSRTTPAARSKPPPARGTARGLPPSTSLTHIRTLTAQMQRLEARVQSARSKLPAPNPTPPRASPRGSLIGSSHVTTRTRKRPGSVSSVSTNTTNTTAPDDSTPTGQGFNRSVNGRHMPRLGSTGVGRLSFGPGPLPNRGPTDSASEMSRPSSRASASSYARPSSRLDGRYDSNMIAPPRPSSRAGGAYTPLGRPISRASFSTSLHGHTMSYSTAEEEEPEEKVYRTPSRRGTLATSIPTPSGLPIPGSRRTSVASATTESRLRRPSMSVKVAREPATQLGDLGETY